jgi:hypothetical protein
MEPTNPPLVITTEMERPTSRYIVQTLGPGTSIHPEVAPLMDLDGEEMRATNPHQVIMMEMGKPISLSIEVAAEDGTSSPLGVAHPTEGVGGEIPTTFLWLEIYLRFIDFEVKYFILTYTAIGSNINVAERKHTKGAVQIGK